MSDTTNTPSPADAGNGAAVSADTGVPATQAAAAPAPATSAAPAPDAASASMRQALLRAQVAQVLGPVQAGWVLDAAIASAKPDLLADFTGLTSPSMERVRTWKAENAFAFAQAQNTQTTQVQPVSQNTTPPAEVLPATPGSNTGAAAGLSTDQLRRLGQVHVNPAAITAHPDWSRVKAFWGVA